ncbi:MAG: hypothetical protein AAFR44_16395, partial [Pseudomonadota bacterium]
MTPAPLPPDEALRLAALLSFRVLDTPPEESFQRIVRLARRLLDVPVAYVALLDADRLWLKARVGIEVEEVARHEAFCAHTVLGDEVMVFCPEGGLKTYKGAQIHGVSGLAFPLYPELKLALPRPSIGEALEKF